MSEVEGILICGKVDLIGGSVPTACHFCNDRLLISPASQRDLPPNVVPTCESCAVKHLASLSSKGVEHEFGGLLPHQLNELGVPKEKAKLVADVAMKHITELVEKRKEELRNDPQRN